MAASRACIFLSYFLVLLLFSLSFFCDLVPSNTIDSHVINAAFRNLGHRNDAQRHTSRNFERVSRPHITPCDCAIDSRLNPVFHQPHAGPTDCTRSANCLPATSKLTLEWSQIPLKLVTSRSEVVRGVSQAGTRGRAACLAWFAMCRCSMPQCRHGVLAAVPLSTRHLHMIK